ncbi:MAG: oligopeptide transporter substrate-binding protein [Pseudonocardiales bacterium]|nr:oligopeptide transporter substrate-binding protein [Pseudonocardiales bacterium]
MRSYNRRWIAAAAASIAVVMLAASCGGSSSGGGSSSSSDGPAVAADISVPLPAPLAVIDPTVDTAAGGTVYGVLFRSLVFNGLDGPVPALAKSWAISPDGLTWTYTLDTSLKFQDGSAFDSADVLFTFQKMLTAGNPHLGTLSIVASIEAPTPDTFVFHLKTPNAAFIILSGGKSIVPSDYYQSVGADGFSKSPIGAGPYKFDSAVAGGGVKVTAWADYPIKQPFKSIDFVPVPSPQAQIAGLQTGTLDVVANVAASQVETLKSDSKLKITETEGNNVAFIAFNTGQAPMSSLDFREGVDLAFDRDAMVKTLLSGHGVAAGGLITQPTIGYPDLDAPKYDATAAKAAIKKSGYDGSAINLTYPTSVLLNADLTAQAVASYLNDVGVKVTLIPLDYTTFLQQWAAKTIQGMYIMGYNNGIDADTIISSLYAGGSRVLFTDDAVTTAVALTRTTSGDVRVKALKALEELVMETKHYYAPLMMPNVIYASTAGLPFTPNAFSPMYAAPK